MAAVDTGLLHSLASGAAPIRVLRSHLPAAEHRYRSGHRGRGERPEGPKGRGGLTAGPPAIARCPMFTGLLWHIDLEPSVRSTAHMQETLFGRNLAVQ